MLLDVTIQPVMFVLLFAYVFGGSIDGPRAGRLPGVAARPGSWPRRSRSRSFIVAIGLTADIDKGIVDRFRSLPINPASILVGRSMSSLIHSFIGIIVMSLTGLFIGWRIRERGPRGAAGYGLLLLVGLRDDLGRHPRRLGDAVGRGGQRASCSPRCSRSRSSPTPSRPPSDAGTVLRAIAEWNPISALVQAVRELWGNDRPGAGRRALPMQHPVLFTILWTRRDHGRRRAAGAAGLPQPHPAVSRHRVRNHLKELPCRARC